MAVAALEAERVVVLVVLLVADEALRSDAGQLAVLGMARAARELIVPSHQPERSGVVDRARCAKRGGGVAARAVLPVSALVHVEVTVGAGLAHLGKGEV